MNRLKIDLTERTATVVEYTDEEEQDWLLYAFARLTQAVAQGRLTEADAAAAWVEKRAVIKPANLTAADAQLVAAGVANPTQFTMPAGKGTA